MSSFTIGSSAPYEEEIRKSRFIATACQVDDVVSAMRFIQRAQRVPASHHAWAYRIGQSYRFSDDGEPTGTAGKPILQAITGQQCDHVVVVVTRWFGGIELGTGGLVRAYGGCAAACLRAATLVPLVHRVQAYCRCDFADLSLVKSRLSDQGVQILSENFDATGAILSLSIPDAAFLDISQLLAGLSKGRIRLQRAG